MNSKLDQNLLQTVTALKRGRKYYEENFYHKLMYFDEISKNNPLTKIEGY